MQYKSVKGAGGMTSVLPYWDQNIELEIVPWIPYGKDFSPVTVNSMYSATLGNVAGLAFEMSSEFLYLRSFNSGNVGTMARQNMIDPARNRDIELGFTMVFTYSEPMEVALLPLLHKYQSMKAGLTLCGIWSDNVLIDECKVIMLVSEETFFDEESFLESLQASFRQKCGRQDSNISFFAEKFGYRRFSISYETDNLMQMQITQALFNFELEATKELLGPAPELPLPFLPGLGG